MARLLTFLVTDLVGNSEFLDRLGEARNAELQSTYVRLLRGALTATGGREVASTGDAVTVTFEGPSEAVAAAVAMQRAFERHNAERRGRLDVRIGISVAEVGDAEPSGDGTSLGVSAARAMRLCDAALGGQVLVSNLVAVLVGPRGDHVLRRIGLLELSGFAEPMPAFEVEYR